MIVPTASLQWERFSFAKRMRGQGEWISGKAARFKSGAFQENQRAMRGGAAQRRSGAILVGLIRSKPPIWVMASISISADRGKRIKSDERGSGCAAMISNRSKNLVLSAVQG